MNIYRRQRGLTMVSIAALLGVLAFFVLIILTLLPVYMENFNVTSHLERLGKDSSVSSMTPDEIRSTFLKRLGIDNVANVSKEDIIISKNDTGYEVEVDYEVRKNVMGNVDAVVFFNEKVVIDR